MGLLYLDKKKSLWIHQGSNKSNKNVPNLVPKLYNIYHKIPIHINQATITVSHYTLNCIKDSPFFFNYDL